MEFHDLPDEIIDAIISHCDISRLLQLRLVSTRTKFLVDTSTRFPTVLQDVQIKLHATTLPTFVETAPHLPFSNFYIEFHNTLLQQQSSQRTLPSIPRIHYHGLKSPTPTPHFYQDSPEHVRIFKQVFCPNILKLRVSNMFAFTEDSEMEFFNSLINLIHLEIEELKPLVPGTTISPESVQDFHVNSPRLPSKEVGATLKYLAVDRVVEGAEYFVNLLSSFPSLEVLKLPLVLIGTLHQGLCQTWISNESLLPSILHLGANNKLKRLRVLDLNRQSADLTKCTQEERRFLQELVSNKKLCRLERVSHNLLQNVQDDPLFGFGNTSNFHQRVVSFTGVSQLLKEADLRNLGHLDFTIDQTSTFHYLAGRGVLGGNNNRLENPEEIQWNLDLLQLQLPALKMISGDVMQIGDLPDGEGDFLRRLFLPQNGGGEPRTSVTHLNLRYATQPGVTVENAGITPECLDTTFPNLTHLRLEADGFSRQQMPEMMEVITRKHLLEELFLSFKRGIPEQVFFGPSPSPAGELPIFLRLQNLRRLELLVSQPKPRGTIRFGNRLLVEVFAKMSLTHLRIFGCCWEDVTSDVLRALEEGPFGRSILWAHIGHLKETNLNPEIHPYGVEETLERLCHKNRVAKGLASTSFEQFRKTSNGPSVWYAN